MVYDRCGVLCMALRMLCVLWRMKYAVLYMYYVMYDVCCMWL